MKISIVSAAMFTMAAAVASGQMPSQPAAPISAAQRMFEAGQYDQALQAIAEARERQETDVADAFLAAHVQLRRSQNDAAKGELARLIESGDDTWRLIGESTVAYVDQNADRALELVTEATNQITERNAQAAAAAGGQLPPQDPATRVRDGAAFYQLGLVKSRREDWTDAAAAFDRTAQLNPSFAYAHYYAGLSYSRLKRPDMVGARFEVFLKLAPNAPERASVMSMMRTLRGA
jgi:tetratricopeptide (TPR) repeat protein